MGQRTRWAGRRVWLSYRLSRFRQPLAIAILSVPPIAGAALAVDAVVTGQVRGWGLVLTVIALVILLGVTALGVASVRFLFDTRSRMTDAMGSALAEWVDEERPFWQGP